MGHLTATRPSAVGHIRIAKTLVNRRSFQQLADLRLREADALLQVKEWSGAYYLAGYAIECGLKARVVRQFKHWDLPDLQRVKEI